MALRVGIFAGTREHILNSAKLATCASRTGLKGKMVWRSR